MERWKRQFNKEKPYIKEYDAAPDVVREKFLSGDRILSDNYDTVASIDFPHYCNSATEGCGGKSGWCYTLVGYQTSEAHAKKVAAVDILCRKFPVEFGRVVSEEVYKLVARGILPYPNLRVSGSGEISSSHIEALINLISHGVHLWGFSKNLELISKLNFAGAHFIFSTDATTPKSLIEKASTQKVSIAYTSTSVSDIPPENCFVVFPLHKVGRVKEVVDHPSLCPKVVDEFFNGQRQGASCQLKCQKCHGPSPS